VTVGRPHLHHPPFKAVERGELPATADVELLSALPLAVLQHQSGDRETSSNASAVERIVRQLFSLAATEADRETNGRRGAATGLPRRLPREGR
jgi:hypothetical protein